MKYHSKYLDFVGNETVIEAVSVQSETNVTLVNKDEEAVTQSDISKGNL